jgi:hypothetical protein
MAKDRAKALQVAPFPEDLHRRVKAAAAMRGLTLQQAAVQALTAWVEASEPPQAAAAWVAPEQADPDWPPAPGGQRAGR